MVLRLVDESAWGPPPKRTGLRTDRTGNLGPGLRPESTVLVYRGIVLPKPVSFQIFLRFQLRRS